ncbi:MAG: DnaD domain protein [Clostridiales Family XIII bacterium]|jgi:DnaD/phage-associated family protein|nr:DnaD domain protein [Clostridiales Family XIII bacterium]
MNFKKEQQREYYLSDTHVENIFINEMMAGAPGDYVKVYLFALMYAELGLIMRNEDVAKHLSLEIEDVLKAWSYWEDCGVIRKHCEDPENRLRYEVEFLNLKAMIYGGHKKKASGKRYADGLAQGVRDLLANEGLREVCREVESLVGAPLSSEDLQAVASWASDFGATAPVIVFAFRYAAERKGGAPPPGRRTHYVGKIVRTWTENGLRTVEEVKRYLEENDKRRNGYKRVLKALGMTRGATEEEQRIMDRWFDALGFDMETVLEACKRTSGITSPNMNYVNSILNDWAEKGRGARSASGARGSAGRGKKRIAEVMSLYEELREKAEREAEARRQEVYARLPEVRRMDEEIRTLNMDRSKALLSGAGNARGTAETLHRKIGELQSERAVLMTENGFRIDCMDILYSCKDCKDTGTRDDGTRCACFAQRLETVQSKEA